MNKHRKVTIMKGDGRPFIVRKQGRNALCFCGSGKKAKHCRGENEKFFVKKRNQLKA